MFDKTPGPSNRLHYAMLGLAAVASIAAAIYSGSTANSLRGSISLVTHTLNVQRNIDELLADNQMAETQGLRFMISQRPDFLADYERSLAALQSQIEKLQKATNDNPDQVALIAELKSAVSVRNSSFNESIEVSRAGPIQAVSARVREGGGSALTKRIRTIAREMALNEAKLLIGRQDTLDRTIIQTTITALLVNVLALIVGGIALVSLRRSARAFDAKRIAQLEATQAARASQEKSAFLASMSHEIRTPMNAVFGFSQLLAKTKIEPQAREYIKAIQTSGRALLALINDILDLSKIEAGKLPLTMAATDIRELVDSTMAVFSESADQKKLTLRAKIAPSVPRALVVDPHRLRQVLMNIISNAIKYSDEGTVSVVVGTYPSALAKMSGKEFCDLHIAIRDTGIGIGPEQQKQLFEPFYRAVGDDSERQGTGLGLAIVRRLLSLMNGEISLVSAEGQGSTFSIRLLGVEISTIAAHALDEGEQDVDFSRLTPSRILIVDDVPWNRDLLAAFLAEGDHNIAFAGDGEEALRVASEHHPDVVLMDLRMPKLNGRAAAQQLRETYGEQSPAVIAVSASSMSREERDLGDSFDGYIRKPVAREVLFQMLLEHIGLKHQPPADDRSDHPPPASVSSPTSVSEEERAVVISRLQRIVRDELEGTLARLRVAEVKKLAIELGELGERGGLPSISYFAQRLRGSVDRFDIMQMDSLLHQLTDHVLAAAGTLEDG